MWSFENYQQNTMDMLKKLSHERTSLQVQLEDKEDEMISQS